MEAFSDGVMAILITIMVLELKVPHEPTLEALRPLFPVFLSYVLSFIYLGIYWNNHHHLIQAVQHVNGRVLWANLHLLFWLSLIPFTTGWMGENEFAKLPTAIYGVVLLMAAFAYIWLQGAIVRVDGPESPLARAKRHAAAEALRAPTIATAVRSSRLRLPLAISSGGASSSSASNRGYSPCPSAR